MLTGSKFCQNFAPNFTRRYLASAITGLDQGAYSLRLHFTVVVEAPCQGIPHEKAMPSHHIDFKRYFVSRRIRLEVSQRPPPIA